ncbi:TM2 domain-containing protein [Spirulina sp. CCNP1310]|uniref:TM2 domain-containing protein n=1 Tax=Spirulina sp. CCNP1310 TaxID=3110249 RepID=UPI002B1ECC48|nr:TM2 domain-containing protein [Spirulina sp. CCNP1310]MEA5419886.1 TM2 domain-containing protein [Spirulina sp. CCNP1310]
MRNKVVAILLTFFLGWFGVHQFYLGQNVRAFFYLIFCWTWIPALLSIFDFVGLLLMSEEDFERRFNDGKRGKAGQAALPSRKLQQRLLKVCKEYRGATLSDCVIETGADLEEVKMILDRFARQGLVSVENRIHDGAVIYKTI